MKSNQASAQSPSIYFLKTVKKILRSSIRYTIRMVYKLIPARLKIKIKNFIKSTVYIANHPVTEFDKKFYLECYPDVAASGADPYEHFIMHGMREGRVGKMPQVLHMQKFSPEKPTVLVVSHEMSRTGAPILAWNICQELKTQFNVIGIALRKGEAGDISAFFAEACDLVLGPFSDTTTNQVGGIVNCISKYHKINFAIVNSFESRHVLQALADNAIPSVFLVHEFYAYLYKKEFLPALKSAGAVVFPAKIVQENAINDETRTVIATTHVFAQGKSEIPNQSLDNETRQKELNKIKAQIFADKQSATKPFIILGAGTIEYRKGIDLFVATAQEIKRIDSTANIIMIWIGTNSKHQTHYTDLVHEQIIRYGVQENCKIIDTVSNLEDVYSIVDLFFLSSRLDPLPNVTIDAMSMGIPTLCFEKASGIAEFLQQTPETEKGIIPFANVNEAAKRIIELYRSAEDYSVVAQKTKLIAQENFNMKQYVAKLITLAENQVKHVM